MQQGLAVAAALAAAGWVSVASQAATQAKPDPKVQQGAMKAGATAELKNREGQTIGRAQLTDTPHGVLIRVNLDKAPAGEHAFHIHDVGQCNPPTFESAGGHFNPTKLQHGFMDAKGPHLGDLPNIHVPSSGQLSFEYLANGVTLTAGPRSLMDENGAALVMHAKPDDYRTDPSGAAGDRIACGIVQKS